MISKPTKLPTEVKSYRSISLLSVLLKLYERILQVRIKRIIEQTNLIPKHQFGFRNAHSTIDQVHRMTDVMERALEEINVCAAIFLDVSKAFDKVSHKGLLTKLRNHLPRAYCTLFKG